MDLVHLGKIKAHKETTGEQPLDPPWELPLNA
jgi:hypothetical protein